jgi:hypothetical protein
LNPVVFPRIILVVNSYFIGPDLNTSFDKIIEEKKKLEVFRLKLESIISTYSLHVDDEVISEISDLCLDIKAFDIKFQINYGIDDLIESGYKDREYIFGIFDIAEIYEKFLITLKCLINNKNFEIELEKNGHS